MSGELVKIVTGVREPLARNISAYFQTMPDDFVSSDPIENTHREFLAYGAHYAPLLWFDLELNRHFGVDVYDHKFDKEQGYTVIREAGIEVFVYRIENLDNAIVALGDFLGRPGARLRISNKASDKPIATTYQAFCNTFVPPDGLRSDLYESRYFRHFYEDRDRLW
jgi:hypothetical protein